MKKQFQHIKNFVQDIKDINLNTRDNKNETLSSDLQKAEKKLDLIKQVCHNTEKKLIACLQLLPTGHLNNNSFTERNLNNVHPLTISSINNSLSSNTEDQLMDTLLLEKKQKKVPEVQLHQTLQEMGDLFDNDSILGVTLSVSGDIQKQLSKELLRYEQDVERLCLFPLNDIMENDIPAVLKSRNQFSKASSEVDKLKVKLNQANKNNQQNGSNQSHQRIKIDSLTKELQDATNRLVQIKNNFVMDLYNFVGREAEFSCIYVQLFKLRANYHKNVLEIIEQNMPRLENIILSTSQKPVFGTSLVDYSKQTNLDLSIVLEYCLCLLNENLSEEGLFRIPGSSSKVKKLKTFFNFQTYQMIQDINNNLDNSHKNFYLNSLEYFDEYVNDPHSVAGCLKSFFRELPEPLFMFSIYHDLINCASITNINDRLTSLWKIINTMPSAHIENLKYLVKFFSKLSANSEVNKMNAQNIAIAIGPSLIWPPPDKDIKNSPNSAYNLDMCSANQYGIIIETLIMYADWFFPGDLDFDIIKKNNFKSSENGQNQNVKTTTQSTNFNQNSPKTQSKAFSFKDRNPLPTPRMSTRIKKNPAPQAPNNLSNPNIPNDSNNFNDSPLNATNSFFNLNNTGNSNSYCFNDFKFQNDNTESEIPTLKSFERKGSFHEKKQNKFSKIVYNNSSTTNSSSNSQDSVNSFNTNSDSKKNLNNFQDQKPILIDKNKSNDSLLANEEINSENYLNSSSSSEELNLSKSAMVYKSEKKVNKNLIQENTPESRYIGGSLDRRQMRNLQLNDRSRQIRQKSSYSFLNTTNLRPKSKDRPQSLHIERPNIPPPERPIKIDKNSVKFHIKIKSHDDLLSDELKNEEVNFSDQLDNFNSNQSVEFNSFKPRKENKSFYEDVNNDKKFNLKLNVKGRNYSEDNLLIESNSKDLVSYVNLDNDDFINSKSKNRDFENQKDINFNQSNNFDSVKPPEKPPRISPSLITKNSNDINVQNNESKIKPPRPSPPSIYKSKSLVNEHTYL